MNSEEELWELKNRLGESYRESARLKAEILEIRAGHKKEIDALRLTFKEALAKITVQHNAKLNS